MDLAFAWKVVIKLKTGKNNSIFKKKSKNLFSFFASESENFWKTLTLFLELLKKKKNEKSDQIWIRNHSRRRLSAESHLWEDARWTTSSNLLSLSTDEQVRAFLSRKPFHPRLLFTVKAKSLPYLCQVQTLVLLAQ